MIPTINKIEIAQRPNINKFSKKTEKWVKHPPPGYIIIANSTDTELSDLGTPKKKLPLPVIFQSHICSLPINFQSLENIS